MNDNCVLSNIQQAGLLTNDVLRAFMLDCDCGLGGDIFEDYLFQGVVFGVFKILLDSRTPMTPRPVFNGTPSHHGV